MLSASLAWQHAYKQPETRIVCQVVTCGGSCLSPQLGSDLHGLQEHGLGWHVLLILLGSLYKCSLAAGMGGMQASVMGVVHWVLQPA